MSKTSLIRHIIICVLFYTHASFANEEFVNQQDFEHHTVRFSLFNSTFIPPDVAANYGLKRSKYENLINVSISPKGEYGAVPVNAVTGTVTNLMQQQKILDFIEINEKTATYYIAPIRISGEDDLHFELKVFIEKDEKPLNIKFNKKLYSDP